MFLCSVRMSKIKIFLAFALVLAAGVIVAIVLAASHSAEAPKQIPQEMNLAAETEEQRAGFLKSFGWEISAQPTEIAEVAIPTEFDEVYQNYNALQKTQGFDLEPYKGQTVKRYCYAVTNYPGGVPNVYTNLLVANGKIIGGDVCSNDLVGFMHGFAL